VDELVSFFPSLFVPGVESIPVEADTSGAVVGFFTNMNALQQSTLIGIVEK
jgi:hypothetical protein